jgi:hypothetical protein
MRQRKRVINQFAIDKINQKIDRKLIEVETESQLIEVMKIKMHAIQFGLLVNLIRMKLSEWEGSNCKKLESIAAEGKSQLRLNHSAQP